MKQRILRIRVENPYGFTLDLKTMAFVKFGIAVGYQETQNCFLEKLDFVIEHALNHESVLGGWKNDQNGKFYFDSVRIFRNDQLEEAKMFGREQIQIAIFDITNFRLIEI
jgi:hypothetical protein